MKKSLFVLALLSSMTIVYAQTFKFPGWKCKDNAVLEEQLALTQSKDYITSIKIIIEFNKNAPNTFDEARAVIETIAEANDNGDIKAKMYLIKQYALHTHQWLDELGAYCLEYPSVYDTNIAIRGYEQKKPWAKQMLVNMLTEYTLDPTKCIQCIDILIEYNLSNEITNAETKDILTKLDIRYTNQLANDKPKWEPVVTKIRTLLDRYN